MHNGIKTYKQFKGVETTQTYITLINNVKVPSLLKIKYCLNLKLYKLIILFCRKIATKICKFAHKQNIFGTKRKGLSTGMALINNKAKGRNALGHFRSINDTLYLMVN